MKQTCVAGVDGGGTKTTAIIADRKGNILAEETDGPSNFQIIGVDKSAETILSLIKRCSEKAEKPAGDVRTVVAGLTGAGRPGDQRRMRDALSECAGKQGISFEQIAVHSDARIALEGAFKGLAGIILIAGTGSIAFGKTIEEDVLRVGGWGRIIGDEGSGYSIGRDALNVVAKTLDGRGKDTLLTELVLSKFGLKDQESIIHAVYSDNFDVASVAPLVVEAASRKDRESERILNRAAFELTEHVRTLTFKLEEATRAPRHKIPLCFLGGLLAEATIFTKIVKHKIEFSIPQVTVVRAQATPAYGAVLIALKMLAEL